MTDIVCVYKKVYVSQRSDNYSANNPNSKVKSYMSITPASTPNVMMMMMVPEARRQGVTLQRLSVTSIWYHVSGV